MTIRDQFAANKTGWVPYPGDGHIANARQVSLVAMAFPPLTPGQRLPGPGETRNGNRKWWSTRDLYLEFKNTAKAALAAAGRDDEDWRCVIYRWADETLWGTCCINFNAGNIHGHPWATTDSIAAGYVWTDQPYPSAATIVPDDGQIIIEYAFPDLATYCKHELAWYLRNGYDGVIAGYRAGELAGLEAACRAAMARGYAAGGNAGSDVTKADQHWRRGLAILGADWSR